MSHFSYASFTDWSGNAEDPGESYFEQARGHWPRVDDTATIVSVAEAMARDGVVVDPAVAPICIAANTAGDAPLILWRPGKKDSLTRPGSTTLAELQQEAALRLQTWFRASFIDESEVTREEPEDCEVCGEPFGAQTDENLSCDRCDKCGKFCHAACLWLDTGFKGECSVCADCWQTSPGTGDFRSTPSHFWRQLHAKFTQEPAPSPSAVPDSVCSPRLNVAAVEEAVYEPLDRNLDYILKFLEGHHAKSHAVSSTARDTIMDRVKDTIRWKSSGRSPQEVEGKIKELNAMMISVVSDLK